MATPQPAASVPGLYNRGLEREVNSPEHWQRFEGQTIDGLFPLRRYLGGSSASGVFLTEYGGGQSDPERAAIKLIPAAGAADAASDQRRLLAWQNASTLSQLHLIKIFAAGECELDGAAFLYVVMEYAE